MQFDQPDQCLLRASPSLREGDLCLLGIYRNERLILKSNLQLEYNFNIIFIKKKISSVLSLSNMNENVKSFLFTSGNHFTKA